MQAYLEDFYKFCQELGGTTADVMSQILQVRRREREEGEGGGGEGKGWWEGFLGREGERELARERERERKQERRETSALSWSFQPHSCIAILFHSSCPIVTFIHVCPCPRTVQFEADRRAFIITINSFGTELSMDDREKLYPTCGKLHPDGLARLARCEDYDQVKVVADCYPVSQCILYWYLLMQLYHMIVMWHL